MGNQMKENTGAPSVESLVKRGCLFLEDSDWNKADEYFDKALDINPEHAPAYIGKLCVELMIRREETLGDYKGLRESKKFDRLLGEYGYFQKALRFADDSYLKKLDGYEQKIKESFPKTIPQRFTDEFINNEIAKLENEIANCDTEIANGEKAASLWRGRNLEASKKRQEMINQHNNMFKYDYKPGLEGFNGLSANEIVKASAWKHLQESYSYQSCEKEIIDTDNKVNDAWKRVNEYQSKKTEYEAKIRELEPLAGISCLDRMDIHYNYLVQEKNKASTEGEYQKLTPQFRAMNGYKDTTELANECEKAAVTTKYNQLVQTKNRASTESEFQNLAPQFRAMNGYKDTTELANECEKAAVIAKYNQLVQTKNRASTEEEYLNLAKQFRAMNGYKDTIELASECDNQYQVLKERREEQERIDRERKAQQERIEREKREEQERIEREHRTIQKKKEEEEEKKQRLLRISPIILEVIAVILSIPCYIQSSDFGLIPGIIFLGGSFCLIYFRDPRNGNKLRITGLVFSIIFSIGIIGIGASFILLGLCSMLAAILAFIFHYHKKLY